MLPTKLPKVAVPGRLPIIRRPQTSFRIPAKYFAFARALLFIFAVVAFILAVTYGAQGFGLEPSAPEDSTAGGGEYVPPEGEAAPGTLSGGRTSEADFQDIAVVMSARVARASYDGVITARLAPDGTSYLVNGYYQRGTRHYYGFKVYDPQGSPLWEHLFADTAYRSSDACYLAGGDFIAAQAVNYDEEGELGIFDSRGRSVLQRSITGWTRVAMSEDGSWAALFNEKHRTVQVYGPPDLTYAYSVSVGPGASCLFLDKGPQLLISEAGRARLFSGAGKVVWSVAIPGGRRWNPAFSPDGKYLAAASEDPDSTVYYYSTADGTLLWSQFLVAGGKKQLAFSPDAAALAVADVGQYGDIYLMNTATGEIAWRFHLSGQADAQVTVKSLAFTPSGENMVADLVELTQTENAYLFYHYLLLMTLDGRALWVSPLGSDVDVDVAPAAGLAVVATNNPINAYGDVTNTLTLVSFATQAKAGGDGGG